MQDSVTVIDEVVVEGNRLSKFTIGTKIHKIDSLVLQNNQSQNLGDVLSYYSHSFIKSHGPSNLSTISLRGTSAHHTAVLWNGFNIQSPSLGLTDFSFLPVTFINDVAVQYGGSGALFGSGAMGGVIHLNSHPKYNTGFHSGLSLTSGSFGNHFQSALFKISKSRLITSVAFYNTIGENNFIYKNTAEAGNPTARQQNSAVSQKGLLLENFLRIKSTQQLSFRIWLQDNFREVPPLMISSNDNSSIANKTTRVSAEWKRTGEINQMFFRSAYFNEVLLYRNPVNEIQSDTKIETWISELETNIKGGEYVTFNLGLNNTYASAFSQGYKRTVTQNRTALFLSSRFINNSGKLKANVSLREEMFEERLLPVMPSAGIEWKVNSLAILKLNASRNYRLPTLNDLYWVAGGNPSLLPETGWSQDVSINTFRKSKAGMSLHASICFYNSNIRNRIIWLPSSNGLWSPVNLDYVWSRGMETEAGIKYKSGNWIANLSAMYSYTVSTNEKSRSAGDNSKGKQLMYVPVYSGNSHLDLGWKSFLLTLQFNYTGNRFTSTDNSEYVQGFHLMNLILSENIKIRNFNLRLHTRINNLSNQSYQVVQWQAMPGRNYQIGISFNYKQPNKAKQ